MFTIGITGYFQRDNESRYKGIFLLKGSIPISGAAKYLRLSEKLFFKGTTRHCYVTNKGEEFEFTSFGILSQASRIEKKRENPIKNEEEIYRRLDDLLKYDVGPEIMRTIKKLGDESLRLLLHDGHFFGDKETFDYRSEIYSSRTSRTFNDWEFKNNNKAKIDVRGKIEIDTTLSGIIRNMHLCKRY